MKFLLPLDYSAHSINAFEYAYQLSQALDAELEVFHVLALSTQNEKRTAQEWAAYTDHQLQEAIEEMRIFLKANSRLIDDEALEDIRFTAASGNAVKEIIEKVEDNDPDYVIMGTKGSNAVNVKGQFGSVTATVMDSIKVPLIAVPIEAEFKPLEHILIAEDLDRNDEVQLQKVFKIANRFGSKIAILHISELADYDNVTRKLNYQNIKYGFARTQKNLDFIFERGMNNKADTLEKVANNNSSDLVVLICRDRKNAKQGLNGLTKAAINQIEVPILSLHSQLDA